jgi:hypothetical protein
VRFIELLDQSGEMPCDCGRVHTTDGERRACLWAQPGWDEMVQEWLDRRADGDEGWPAGRGRVAAANAHPVRRSELTHNQEVGDAQGGRGPRSAEARRLGGGPAERLPRRLAKGDRSATGAWHNARPPGQDRTGHRGEGVRLHAGGAQEARRMDEAMKPVGRLCVRRGDTELILPRIRPARRWGWRPQPQRRRAALPQRHRFTLDAMAADEEPGPAWRPSTRSR